MIIKTYIFEYVFRIQSMSLLLVSSGTGESGNEESAELIEE